MPYTGNAFGDFNRCKHCTTPCTVAAPHSTKPLAPVELKVTNMENIASTQAVNIVRLPAAELTPDEQEALPSQSFGDETVTEDVGWYTIAVLGLVVAIVVFVLLVRVREDDELLTLPELGPAPQILNDGSPDPEGLPTVLDDDGQLWRKHPDGSLDWWDPTYNIWQRW